MPVARSLTASSFLSNWSNSPPDDETPYSNNASAGPSNGLYVDRDRQRQPSFGSVMSDVKDPRSRHQVLSQLQNMHLSSSAPSLPPFFVSQARPQASPSPMAMDGGSDAGSVGLNMATSPAAAFLAAASPDLTPGSHFPQSHSTSTQPQMVRGYTLGRTIGVGGQSVIRKAHSSSGGVVAIKIVHLPPTPHLSPYSTPAEKRERRKARKVERALRKEAQIWSSLSHEHIIPLFLSSFSTTSHSSSDSPSSPFPNDTKEIYFITLYCPLGSLYDILSRSTPSMMIPQDDAGVFFRQIVRGLRYLHVEMGLVHGDVKAENVLVDEQGVARIGDFGMSRWVGCETSGESGSGSEDHSMVEEDEEVDDLPGRSSTRPLHLNLRRKTAGHAHTYRPRKSSTPIPVGATSGIKHTTSLIVRRNEPSSSYQHPRAVTTSSSPPPQENQSFPRGSLPYVSPELLHPTYSSRHDGKVIKSGTHTAQDIWALGVLLYLLLSGGYPFNDSYQPRLVDKIVRGTYVTPPGIGSRAVEILRGCLEKEWDGRWEIERVDEGAWGIGWGEMNKGSDSANREGEIGDSKPPSPIFEQTTIPEEDIDDEPDFPRGRRTQPVARRGARPNRPALPPLTTSRSRSVSRSHSRPPHSFSYDEIPTPLEPVTSRISVSVERKGRREESGMTRSHSNRGVGGPDTLRDGRGPGPDASRDRGLGRKRSATNDAPPTVLGSFQEGI